MTIVALVICAWGAIAAIGTASFFAGLLRESVTERPRDWRTIAYCVPLSLGLCICAALAASNAWWLWVLP